MELDSLDLEIPLDKKKYIENTIGIKLTKKTENFLKKYSDITSLISSINFEEKKKTEYKNNIIAKIKNISLNKIEEPYNLKLSNRTQCFYTAKNDSISETMYAFYFCEPKNNVSDKEAVAMKGINLHSSYDITLENYRKKDEEELSSNSNNLNSPIKLKKKRKISGNFSKSNKSKKKKIIKEDLSYNRNSDDNEYCIPECKLGRKNSNLLMIQCDNCGSWYHTSCVGVVGDSNKISNMECWFCPNCQKKDNEKDSKMDIDNNNNNS